VTAIQNRYDFIFLFDVTDGNPNGDPDAGNLPRMDPETRQGLVSDVALKRKLRNYVELAKGHEPGHRIYMTEGTVLNEAHQEAYDAAGIKPDTKGKRKPKDEAKANEITAFMCRTFYDIRTFGAVMSTEKNAGQVRGPVQMTFARSVEPIMPIEAAITRQSVTNEKDRDNERTMGRKSVVPYGLYLTHGYVNAALAEKNERWGEGAGMTEDDLTLFWTGLSEMFEHDRSASRGTMVARRGIAFKHDCKLGKARAHELFERVRVMRLDPQARGREATEDDMRAVHPVRAAETHNWEPARSWRDYAVLVDRAGLPEGVEIVEFC